jgi:alpha-L-fucosidase 2
MQHPDNAGDALTLWYGQPAEAWPDALPVGNGRLAAMVYGGVRAERINLDESTFWAGEPSAENVPSDGPATVTEIRRLLFAGEIAAANELTNAINGRKLNYGTHLPFGTLRLFFNHGDDDATDYRRALDLDRGVASVTYTVKGVVYRREVFASHDSQVLVVRLTCDQPGGLTFRVALDGGEQPYQVRAEGAQTLLMDCDAYEPAHSNDATGVHGHARLTALADGAVSVVGTQLRVAGAARVTLLIAIQTTFAQADPAGLCREQIAAAAAQPYADLLAAHLADHRTYFRRVALDLGPSPHPDWPVDRRIAAARGGEDDPALCALLFQFGRYMLLSSSRPDSPLPAHLTGIWNDGIACRIGWTCDCHLDINTQMNYWIAELANLRTRKSIISRSVGNPLSQRHGLL